MVVVELRRYEKVVRTLQPLEVPKCLRGGEKERMAMKGAGMMRFRAGSPAGGGQKAAFASKPLRAAGPVRRARCSAARQPQTKAAKVVGIDLGTTNSAVSL